MSGGIDRLVKQVAGLAATNTQMRYDRFLSEWTPIEALFLAGFIAQVELNEHGFSFGRERSGKTFGEAGVRMDTVEIRGLWIFPQCQFEDWRVDFLVGLKLGSGDLAWLIVECDGHDFHERTKEQAAKDRSRDRAYQAKGYGVFRFTGSELYRDPLGRAGEVYAWLMNQFYFGGTG